MAKVSIIVPIYNVEPYLAKCLDSLTEQTLKDIKIYAISDGSPDNSLKIAKKYAKKDPRIICIEKENGGYGSVLEYAIRQINTEYFLICDPDDWLSKDAAEILYHEAHENNLDLVVGDRYDVYSDGTTTYGNANSGILQVRPNHIATKNLDHYSFLSVSPHAKLYRTALAKNINFPHKTSYTDIILYLAVLMHSSRIKYVNLPLAYYRIDRAGNTTTDRSIKAIQDHLTVTESLISQLTGSFESHPCLSYRIFRELKISIDFYCKIPRSARTSHVTARIAQIKTQLQPYSHSMITLENLSFRKRLDTWLFFHLPLRLYLALTCVRKRGEHA